MKICFYRHSLLNRGGDKMVVEYANYLQSRGHAVTILTNHISTVYNLQADVRRISAGTSKVHTILHACAKKWPADIIIADIIMMTFFLSFRNGNRMLYFAQDYDESYYKSLFVKQLIRMVYYFCLTFLKIPVVAVSEDLGRLLKTRFNANVSVVENGVDTSRFYPDRDTEYLALKGARKAVLVFARSDYRKGFDIAVKVLTAFRNEIDAGSLVVWAVGEKLNMPFNMHHFGFVPPASLRKILSCSDVLLYPSRHEGLPLFVLEAMASGCPVVTTEAVQFVSNSIDAAQCRVDDVDALRKQLQIILVDEEVRSRLIREAFATAVKFDLRNSMIRFESVLTTLSGQATRTA